MTAITWLEDRAHWCRPRVQPQLYLSSSDIDFELVDIKSRYVRPDKVAELLPFDLVPGSDQVPVLCVFGVTEAGHSIGINVWNYHPYFYAALNQTLVDYEKLRPVTYWCNLVRRHLEEALDAERRFPRSAWAASQGLDLDRDGLLGEEDEAVFEEDDPFTDEPLLKRRRVTTASSKSTRPDPGFCVVDIEPVTRTAAEDCLAEAKTFLRIRLRTPNMVSKARKLVEDGIYDPASGALVLSQLTYESDIRFENRFMLDRNLGGACWARLAAGKYYPMAIGDDYRHPHRRRLTTCQIEVNTEWQHVTGFHVTDPAHQAMYERPSKMRVVSYDIECLAPQGSFPSAKRDPVIQIAARCYTLGGGTASGENDEPSVIFALKDCDPIEGTTVITHEDEADLLNSFGTFLQLCDPDIITGYNTKGFDDTYVYDRALLLEARSYLFMGRAVEVALRKLEDNRVSRNKGNRQGYVVEAAGRVGYDMMPFIQDNYKLSSYTLNSVAAHFLGDQKEDLHHSMIAVLQKGSSADRRRLGVYCIKDALLPKLLAQRLHAIDRAVEFARLTGIQLRQIQDQGQSVKVRGVILRETTARGLVLPTHPHVEEKGGYKGATVLPPVPGYHEKPVATLDFSSLYPSIMIAHNLCYSTCVPPELRSRFAPEDLEFDPQGISWIRREKRVGLLPHVLETVLARRKLAIKAKENAATPLLQAVYDKRQLSLKEIANSVYGYMALGAYAHVASAVTAYGRRQIERTRDIIEAHFTVANGYPKQARVLYGDSVTGDTPILIRHGPYDVPRLCTIDALVTEEEWRTDATEWHSSEKFQVSVDGQGLEVWSDAGWTQVKRVIRHPVSKPIYRIATGRGSVCVTEDHSLLREDGRICSPVDIDIGTALRHHPYPPSLESYSEIISVDEAFLMGAFFACGSCSSTSTPSWIIRSDQRELLHNLLKRADRIGVEDRRHCRFSLTKDGLVARNDERYPSSHYRRLFYTKDAVEELSYKYHRLFYVGEEKVVPGAIIHAHRPIRDYFCLGYLAFCTPDTTNVIQGQLGAASFHWLLATLDVAASVSIVDEALDLYLILPSPEPTTRVQRIHSLPGGSGGSGKSGLTMVYDLETTNHHFSAGVGELVVHNTDSVMVDFGVELEHGQPMVQRAETPDAKILQKYGTEFEFTQGARAAVEKAIVLANEAAALCTSQFQKPNALQFENIYLPWLVLDRKKRYAGPFWTSPKGFDYIKIRGMETVRRDNAKVVIECQARCLNMILLENNPAGALSLIKSEILRLRMGEVDLGALITSNRLNQRIAQLSDEERRQLKRQIAARGYKLLREWNGWHTGVPAAPEKNDIVKSRWGDVDLRAALTNAKVNKRMPEPGVKAQKMLEKKIGGAGYKAICDKNGWYSTTPPHAYLDYKLRKRNGAGYNIGDRIPYIITDSGWGKESKKDKIYHRAEDPLYVLANNLLPDLDYYTAKFIEICSRPLEPIYGPQVALERLWRGEHMRKIVRRHTTIAFDDMANTSMRGQGLLRFATRQTVCINCKQAVPTPAQQSSSTTPPPFGLCQHCKPNASELRNREQGIYEKLDSECKQLWNQCRDCQGEYYDKIECSAISCPIFFRRTKVKREFERQKSIMEMAW
jgi:DNA polymerase elongation subunit (family B)